MTAEELKALQATLEEHRKAVSAEIKTATESAQAGSEKALQKLGELEASITTIDKSVASVKGQVEAMKTPCVPGLAEELAAGKVKFSITEYLRADLAEQARSGNRFARGVIEDAPDGMFSVADPWKFAKAELEICKAFAKKRSADGQVAGDGSAGGYLIPDEVTSEYIDLVVASMPIMSLGPRVWNGLVGNLSVPKVTSRPTGYMVGEVEKPTHSAMAVGEVDFVPHKAAAFTKQSKRLLYQSRQVADQMLKDLIVEAMALKFEEQLIIGTGTGKQVKGLSQYSGMTTGKVMEAARFRIDDMAYLLQKLDEANEYKTGGNYGALMHPAVKWGMKRERVPQYSGDSVGAPVMAMNLLMTDSLLEQQIGMKFGSTTLVPNNETLGSHTQLSTVYAGNWKLFWIGLWRGMQINVSDQAGDGSTGSAFLDDQIYVVAFKEFDCQLMRETAFTKATQCQADSSQW